VSVTSPKKCAVTSKVQRLSTIWKEPFYRSELISNGCWF